MKMDFESNLKELMAINERLSSAQLTLEESFALYERGRQLVTLCRKQLDKTERQVMILRREESGEMIETPWEDDV